MIETRWLFADQLGPHFLGPHGAEGDDGQRVLLVESAAALRAKRFHRMKAHLILSAMRHRARELGDRATLISAPTYSAAVAAYDGSLSVCDPTSRGARRLVRRLGVTVLPPRGFVTSSEEFAGWVASRGARRLLLDDFYRSTRRKHGILMDGAAPAGGAWTFDADNRLPPPRRQGTLGLPEPVWPSEDDIDESVRAELDARVRDGSLALTGDDGPRRFAVTRAEALVVLADFVAHRLKAFGPYEDATMSGDWVMAHSLLSVPLNLGLLHPMEVVGAAVAAYREGLAPIESVEGLVRQIIGWRDYVWHLYWHLGPDYVRANALSASQPLPAWFRDLDSEQVTARCLSETLSDVRRRGWVHHIPRLMILGNWALQRGYDPAEVTDWFHTSFVDGYEWVMAANVIGMALYADGGVMATKPYAAGGAYISRMTDYCGGCAYKPDVRVGEQACPFSAGYWWFLDRIRPAVAGNHRMAQPLRGLDRLRDLEGVRHQERSRGDSPP